MFLNGILTNAESWYVLSKEDIQQVEDLDISLLKKIFNTKCTVPTEALYLELGCLDISTLLKARRLNYLHYLTTRKENSMLFKFFLAQWNHPTKNDWTEKVREDLEDFGLEADLASIKEKSSWSFKAMVKKKAKEYAFNSFLIKKDGLDGSKGHSKLSNLFYSELKTQDYLKDMNKEKAQAVFAYRTRMAQYSDNYRDNRGHLPCPLCLVHLDCQSVSFNCPVVKENICIKGKYDQIFAGDITPELAQTLIDIDKFCKDFIESRRIE